jgi:hypothetical protein
LFVAGRARGEFANDPRVCDLHCLSSWGVERQTGAFLIGLAELTLAQGRWAILTFHGIAEVASYIQEQRRNQEAT